VDLAAELKKIRFFKELDGEHLDKLAKVCQEYSLSPGDVLCREGDSGDEFYVIVMGTLRADKKTGGSTEEIDRFGSGSYIGEIAFVSDAHPRMATVTAIEKTFVIGLRREDAEKIATADPAIGRGLYRAIAQSLARRVSLYAGEVAHYRAVAQGHD